MFRAIPTEKYRVRSVRTTNKAYGIPFRPAITIIELVVVITILALLLGLLLPVLGRARATAQSASCANRMRQLFTFTQMYCDDHAGFIPQPFEDDDLYNQYKAVDPNVAAKAIWFNALDRYINKGEMAYQHNNDQARLYLPDKQDPVWDGMDDVRQKENRTIKMNKYFGVKTGQVMGSTWRFYRTVHVKRPGNTVMYVDGRAVDMIDNEGDISRKHFHASEGTVALRHNNGANVTFVDGHTRHVNQQPNEDTGNVVLGWYTEATGRQELIWNFLD